MPPAAGRIPAAVVAADFFFEKLTPDGVSFSFPRPPSLPASDFVLRLSTSSSSYTMRLRVANVFPPWPRGLLQFGLNHRVYALK